MRAIAYAKTMSMGPLLKEFIDYNMPVTKRRPRFLITTADERTWPTDQPVLFLGEWCRLYDRKASWENLDAEVVPYHWDDREKLYKDYLYLQGLYEELLLELSTKLNEIHSVDHSLRYWRILIGPWLGYFVQILFDRWSMIERALSDYEIAGVSVLKTPLAQVVPNDMDHFVQLFVTDQWNEAIYSQLLRDFTKVPIEDVMTSVHSQDDLLHLDASNSKRLSLRQRVKKVLAHIVFRSNQFLASGDETFFISSYLPIKQDLLLQVALGQFPRVWTSIPAPRATMQLSRRDWTLGDTAGQGFIRIVRSMIPKHIPTLYLEGYKKLNEQIEDLPWTNKPSLIFTSNSENSDDVFKAWAANKVEIGTPLIIGQHGGNYGVSRWHFVENHEIAICDSYISWGWDDASNPLIKQFGNLKMVHRTQNWDPKGQALLVGLILPRYSYCMYSVPVASQLLNYFEDQFRFTAGLPKEVQCQLLVRLNIQDYDWGQQQRWQDRLPDIRLDDGTASMSSLIKHSRLYISTYNATTFLESLSMNVPTIMFWNPKHWELRADAIPYFTLLKEVGIFHETPESAAKKVAEIWDDVPGWWNQPKIQSAREYFCHRFARTVKNPVKLLKEILTTAKSYQLNH